ncbi:MAG: VanW family protein [Clostridia bacterium]
MEKRHLILGAILLLLPFCLTGCQNKEKQENSNTENTNAINRTNAEQNIVTENIINETPQNITFSPPPEEKRKEKLEEKKEEKKEEIKKAQPLEEEIASASTKIYTKKEERQNNVSITVSKLDGTTVEPGDTFSFTDTIGKATKAKGYEEADIFDKDGNKTQGLGGGNCQVSTTLYQAVKKIDGLKVTERHEHSNDVPYAKKGNDAAVAYGSIDFKFQNNTGHTIRIKAENTKNTITVTLLQVNS